MIDISDGIASDLKHIVKASGVAAHVHLDRLPISEQLVSVANIQDWDALELAIGGGEDYELLFTVAEDKLESIRKEFQTQFDKPLIQIGSMVAGYPEIKWFRSNKEVQLSKTGFNHFQ